MATVSAADTGTVAARGAPQVAQKLLAGAISLAHERQTAMTV
jgi:hypothetical protein